MVKFESGSLVAMAGRELGDDSIKYLNTEDGRYLLQVGDDAGVVLPEYNIVGLFDGAGGAADIGSPRLAARVACEAVKWYFETGGTDVSEALEYARQAVSFDKDTGVCVGAVAQIADGKVTVANAGDTAVAIYRKESSDDDPYIAEPQRDDWGEPQNYLGKCDIPGRLPERISDDNACYELRRGDKIFLMTDGAWGLQNELLEFYHFEAALSDWPIFEQAKKSLPNLEQKIRELLRSSAVRELRDREIINNTDRTGRLHEDMMSVGLRNSDLYNFENTDWLVWQEVVKPHLESLGLEFKQKIGVAAIAGALLSRPIRWPFEKPPLDDATVAVASW